MLRYAIQCGQGCPRLGHASLLEPLVVIAVVAALGAVIVPVTHVAIERGGQARRGWRARRRARRAAAGAEQRARALMSELCPFGWRAVIVVEGSPGFTLGHDEPSAATDLALTAGRSPVSRPDGCDVVLEWCELDGRTGEPLVARRVRGATIREAMEAMVADRRTDETLEAIERRASFDGATWPEG